MPQGSSEKCHLAVLGGLQNLTVVVHPHGDGQKNADHVSVILRCSAKNARIVATLTIKAGGEVLLQEKRLMNWQDKNQKLGWPKAIAYDAVCSRGTVTLSLELDYEN